MRSREAAPPPPVQRSGSALSGLFGVTVVGLAVVLARRPAVGWTVFGGLAVAGVLVLAGRMGAGRRPGPVGGEAVVPRGDRRYVLWLVAAGTLVALWVTRPFLAAGLCVLLAPSILWVLTRRPCRISERTGVVKPQPPAGSVEEVGERWPEFTRRAGLHHPDDAELMAQLIRDPAPNGVGGVVARVDLRAAQLLPEDLLEAAQRLRRVLRFDHVFLGRVSTDEVDVHLYRGTPLADPVPWWWLDTHPAGDPERVSVAATVTGEPATERWRHTTLRAGLTGTGKTTAQLAVLHSITAVRRMPVHVLLLDNRGEEDSGGSELRVLSGLPGVTYRNRTADAWELICLALDIMAGRQATKGVAGELQPSDQRPLVRLLITELVDVLQSRPPKVDDWTGFSRGRFASRPSVDDWRDMLIEGLAGVARKGRDVCVCGDWGAQAGQVEIIPTRLRVMIKQRQLFGVGNFSDIAPVLGDAAGVDAHLIPDWQAGACYLRGPDGRPMFCRGAGIEPADLEEAVVEPMREFGRRVLYVVDGMEETG